MSIIGLTYILFGIALVSWQLWNKSLLSNVLAKLTWALLFLAVSTFGFNAIIGHLNWTGLSVALIVTGICSIFAMFLQSKPKTKIAYLFSTSLLQGLLAFTLTLSPSIKKAENPSSDIPELLVKIFSGQEDSFVEFANLNHKIDIVRGFKPKSHETTDIDDFFVVDILGASPQKTIRDLENHPSVAYVEENEAVFIPAFTSPSKVNSSTSYVFKDPMNKDQWALANTNMNGFYELAKDQKAKKKVKLFILDTGVDGNHEDLKDVYKSTGNKKNDKDVKGHGTHCAGIAAAVTGNNLGISSFNFDKRIDIYSEKVLADYGGGTQAGIIKGIINAVDKGADVISMSLGGMSNDKRQRAYNSAIKYATDHNCIVVVAAGNSSANAIRYSPANSYGVITVAASDATNNLATFSNTIDDIEMGVFAPGVDILSTYPGNRYETFSGTSMATPFVAGLVSLMKSIKPSLTNVEAYQILNSTVYKSSGVPIIDPKTALEKLIVK